MIESDICVVTVAAGIDIDAKTLALVLRAEDDNDEELPPVLPLLPIILAFTGCREELRLPTS